MKTMQLKDNLWWTGVLDPDLRVFDIIMRTEYGTTYNSYVLKGSEKTAIFETNKLRCWDDYKAAVEEIVDIKDVDYIVMNHTEPDHAGSIANLIELNPKITVVATGTAISFLKEIINHDFKSMAVKDGETLSLGDVELKFLVLPNLHWPDTMYTYNEKDKVIFTCDSFGSHYSCEGVVRSSVTDEAGYLDATKYYFDNIIGPFKCPFMVNALKKIKDLDIEMICTGHGPVLDSHLDQVFSLYREWCGVNENLEPLVKPSPVKKVVIPYVSAYGYTAQLAEQVKAGVEQSGNVEVSMYDMVTADSAAVAAEIAAADGVLFGTPTIVGEALMPIWSLLIGMFPPTCKGKMGSAFGSYGWSGEGVPHVLERLKQLNIKVVDGLRIRFKPDDNQLLDAFDWGYDFGCKLQKKENDRKAESKGKSGAKVKCLVCGEVFDPEQGTCPVCGVGPDKWVDAPDTSTDFRKDTEEIFLILGGGPGAYYAADAIRDRNATASIVILTDEDELPYNRPMLTKALLDDFSNDQLAISGKEWFEEKNIVMLTNRKVTAIDTEAKQVACEDGAQFKYDKLIYALGAYCFVPPIKGADKPHVITVRNIADTKKVKALMPKTEKAVCIGGGVMGLEGAWELKKAGIDVTVLETAPGLLPRQLDDPASAMLEDIVNKSGINCVCGAKITEITDDAVLLEDGRSFEAQIVIMSTGMRPHVKVAQEAGIKAERLVEVDLQMQTSAEDVYACGDCTAVNGAQQAFWAQAMETGRIAGANAAGEALEYDPLGASLVINAMNTSIFALGTNGKDPDKKYRTIEIKDTQRNAYEKYYFEYGRLAGVILIGDTSRMVELTDAVMEGRKFEKMFGNLGK